MLRAFRQVDVFSARAGDGNPLAVVLDGEGLSETQMRRFAAWTNLSETTFLLPPTPQGLAAGADYRVRIFTPTVELPFAGHPTLGSCHAWLEAGHTPRNPQYILQECAEGLVRIRREKERLAFAAPPVRRSPAQPAVLSLVASALGIQPQQILASQVLDNGPIWLGLLLDSAATVRQLKPDHTRLKALGQKVGVIHIDPRFTDVSQPAAIVRAFAAAIGITEDPVTGSLNASLAQWLMAEGLAPRTYQSAQGEMMGRNGRVHLECDEQQQVWAGGQCVTCIEGTVRLPADLG